MVNIWHECLCLCQTWHVVMWAWMDAGERKKQKKQKGLLELPLSTGVEYEKGRYPQRWVNVVWLLLEGRTGRPMFGQGCLLVEIIDVNHTTPSLFFCHRNLYFSPRSCHLARIACPKIYNFAFYFYGILLSWYFFCFFFYLNIHIFTQLAKSKVGFWSKSLSI